MKKVIPSMGYRKKKKKKERNFINLIKSLEMKNNISPGKIKLKEIKK